MRVQVAMAQDFINAFYRWFLTAVDVTRSLLPYLLLALLAGLALWLAYEKWSPNGQQIRSRGLEKYGKKSFQIAGLVLALLLICGTLVQARQLVAYRRDTVEQAQASHHKEPQLSGVIQYAPRIGYEAERTYTRTLTLPPQFVDRIGSEGIQVLSPYLSDPSAEGVLKLVDSFKKSGTDVVFTRQLTRLDEITIAADSADVKCNFQTHRTSSGQRYYQATLDGVYRFHNPKTEPATMRFVFPLPEGGGTVEGFYFDAMKSHVTEPDEKGVYSWSGVVPAGGSLSVHAHYQTTGGGNFAYLLGSESRRIGDFHFLATGVDQLKFAKTSIYPSSVGGSTADWKLHDVLTAQSISLVFPRADMDAQLFDKTLSLLPLAAVLFGLVALWLRPHRALVGLACFGLGLASVPVLSSYLPPSLATLAGVLLAIVGGGLALSGRRGWGLSILCGLLCVSFLTGEHGALFAWVVIGIGVVVYVVRRRRVGAPQTL